MTHLEAEVEQLKEAILEMMGLAKKQISKAHTALVELDQDLAQEILHNENRMNAMELSIDRDCENMFALFNPVATDLRFVLAMLKINAELERIGDHAVGATKYLFDLEKPFEKELIDKIELEEMFNMASSMIEDIEEGFRQEDTKLVRKVFKKDLHLNKIKAASSQVFLDYVTAHPESIEEALYLFSTIRKVERVGDLTKNIAEQIIFYLEAEVVKHKKGKK